jgi:hypothetical protein
MLHIQFKITYEERIDLHLCFCLSTFSSFILSFVRIFYVRILESHVNNFILYLKKKS